MLKDRFHLKPLPAGAGLRRVALLVATLAHVGRFPFASGTAATIVWGIPTFLMLGWISRPTYTVVVCVAFLLALWASHTSEKLLAEKDSPLIVVDEWVGYLVAVAFLPWSFETALFGLILFRIFDIFKVYPASWIDANLSGGLGVVLDDVLAGCYANLTLRLLAWLLPQWIQL
ncbi:MAG: phosphatidylglycerophosphatase A [Deltaproteobacteria bacterium]|nr:phosphatidylglycerophosphatase A [Deltaproteobacteria bacterium]